MLDDVISPDISGRENNIQDGGRGGGSREAGQHDQQIGQIHDDIGPYISKNTLNDIGQDQGLQESSIRTNLPAVGPRDGPKLGVGPKTELDFPLIRKVCEKDLYDKVNVDLRPEAFAQYRRENWPDIAAGTMPIELCKIYDVVKRTGLPNAMSARVPIPTTLDIKAWERNLDSIGGAPHIMDFITYGFPIGYLGPISDTRGIANHPSAVDYPRQIADFITKEIEKGGVVGPFALPPFTPWCHISPLMSRPKADAHSRRVITDMTFPREASINSYVIKNGIYGIEMDHSLPTVDNLVQELRGYDSPPLLATLDISRAYKNFNSDPLDWPLLCFGWGDNMYCDVTVPFGSRASSFFMQTFAKAIVDMLAVKGVKALMYLDDIVVISPSRHKAGIDYQLARDLLTELALPEAKEKSQPPSTRVKWLGVIIDTERMSLSIPEGKLQEALEQVSRYTKSKSMTKRQLQSLLGRLLHISKCVQPARLFVSRLLEALRGAKGTYINVNADMRADFRWFAEFCSQWNGCSYIQVNTPSRDIFVDACLSGIGATDGHWAYAGQVTPIHDGARNITELEALNVVVAAHTMLGPNDHRLHVRVHCDNMAAVQVFQTGRGKNKVLLECARALWMIQAILDIHISYVHVAGNENGVADALSRQHLSMADRAKLHQIICNKMLNMIQPCLHVFDILSYPLLSRSGHCITAWRRTVEAVEGTGARNDGQPKVVSRDLRGVRQESSIQPTRPDSPHGMRIYRVPRDPHQCSSDHQEQTQPCENIPNNGRVQHGADGTPTSGTSHGRNPQGQGAHIERKRLGEHGNSKVGNLGYPNHNNRGSGQGRNFAHVLWRPPPVGGGAPYRPHIRSTQAPHTGGSPDHRWGRVHAGKMGQKHAKSGTTKEHSASPSARRKNVPSSDIEVALQPHPNSLIFRTTVNVPQNQGPNSNIGHRVSVGIGPARRGGRYRQTIPPQH